MHDDSRVRIRIRSSARGALTTLLAKRYAVLEQLYEWRLHNTIAVIDQHIPKSQARAIPGTGMWYRSGSVQKFAADPRASRARLPICDTGMVLHVH